MKALLAACACLVDDRMDVPDQLAARRLPNNFSSWQSALRAALADLPLTLERGAAARAAALAMPAIEDSSPPPWAVPGPPGLAFGNAAE